MRRISTGLLAMLLVSGTAVAATTGYSTEATPNMRQLTVTPFTHDGKRLGAGGMAFDGRTFVVTANNDDPNGVGIFRIYDRAPFLRQVGFQRCPGMEVVSLWGRYLIQSVDSSPAYPAETEAAEQPRATRLCDGTTEGQPREGLRITDISNPRRPRFVRFLPTPGGSAGHAVARFGRRIYIYEANDLSPEAPADDQTKTFEIRVFRFFPRRPHRTYLASHATLEGVNGCQNLAVFVPRRIAACTGLNIYAILDLRDPVNPETFFVNTEASSDNSSYFMKTNFTWDGRYLLLGKVGGPTCSQDDGPQNDLVILDVEDPANPVEVGRFSLSRETRFLVPEEDAVRGLDSQEMALWNICGPYSVQVLPMRDPRRYIAIVGYVRGGVSVIDLSDVSSPREIGFFAPDDPKPTHVPFAHWYQGGLYGAEHYSRLGVRVLKMKGLSQRHVHSFRRRLSPNVQIRDFRR